MPEQSPQTLRTVRTHLRRYERTRERARERERQERLALQAAIRAAREDGHTLAAIGQQIGVSPQRVEQILKAA